MKMAYSPESILGGIKMVRRSLKNTIRMLGNLPMRILERERESGLNGMRMVRRS